MLDNGKRKREDDDLAAASVRVQMIQHPELKKLDRRSVEELRILHREYEIQLRAQGARTKPVPIEYCVPRVLREVIAMEKGMLFDQLEKETIMDYLDKLYTEEDTIQIDQKKVFQGIKMNTPKNPCDIAGVISDWLQKINDRKNRYGLSTRLMQNNELELRKQCFPSIIEGIWPQTAVPVIEKRWKDASKKWSLAELIKEIRDAVSNFGPYELLRDAGKKDKYSSKDELTKTSKESWKKRKPFGENRSERKDPKRSDSRGLDSKKKREDVQCYRCGLVGHIRPKCTLADTDQRVIDQKNKLIKKSLKRLQSLTALSSDDQSGKNDAESTERESSDSEQ